MKNKTESELTTTQPERASESDTLKMVSFRADATVINGIKALAMKKGKPYQAVMRHALQNFLANPDITEMEVRKGSYRHRLPTP